MTIARKPNVVLDCPDASALADFYAQVLGWTATADDGWVEIRAEDGEDHIAFQQVENYRAPVWPGQEVPQQMHLDMVVDDLDDGETAVLALGATKSRTQPGESFRVFLDPAGHPFCLCLS